MMKPSGAANYGVSRTGTLVYTPTGAVTSTPITSLVWVDRTGHEEPIGAPRARTGPRASLLTEPAWPSGIVDEGNIDIWIWDLAREKLTRLTFGPGDGWTADVDA